MPLITERHRHAHRRAALAASLAVATSAVACTTTPAHPPAPTATAGKLDDTDFGRLWHATARTSPVPKKTQQPPRPKKLRRTPVTVNGIPAVWLRLVHCESPGRGWRYGAPDVGTDPGYSEYEGGPDFTVGTWLAYRLPGYPRHAYDATPAQQITVAKRVLRDQGPDAWPVCSRRVGLTMAAAA